MQLAAKGHAIVAGYLGKDPESREPNGKRLVDLSIIVDKDKPREGQQYGDTHWCNAVIWGGNANGDKMCDIAECLEKGDQVAVAGKIKEEPYTAKDGTQKISKRLNVEFIIPIKFLWMMITGTGNDAPADPTDKFKDVVDDNEMELPF